MRVPQRLQIVARCLVVLTGNFLNIVANSSFIDRSSSKLDVRQREQRQCQSRWFSLDHEKTLIFSGYCSERAGCFNRRYAAILSRNGLK